MNDLLAAAVAHHRAGRLDQAAALYETILGEAPDQPDALHHSALLALQRGDKDEAVRKLRLAVAAAPDRAVVHNDCGAVLRLAGRLSEAAASLEQATILDPDYADAWNNLGMVRRAAGDLAGARAALERAAALKPDFAPTRNALGTVLNGLGDSHAAIAAFQRAVELKPDYAEALLNLGLAQHGSGDPAAAAASLRRAVAANPSLAAAWHALGVVLAARGERVPACEAFARAARLQPQAAATLSNYGLALHKVGRDEEALAALSRSLAIAPDSGDALLNRGVVRQHRGDYAAAAADWRAAIAADPHNRVARSNLIFALHYEASTSAADLLAAAREYDRVHGEPDGRYVEWPNSRDPERRLRIGYVSPDFREHSVAHYIEPLLAAHDPDAVEVFAYAELQRADAVSERLGALARHWRPTAQLDSRAMARLIREDAIDILVDLAGHSGGNRLDAFALKPAPVQATWLGFPGTTGLSAIDYRLSDAVADPPGAESDATESLLRLPKGFHCWRPPPGAPPIAERVAGAPPVFGSFNNVQKIGDATVALWSEILRRVPDARLMLKAAWLSRPIVVDALRSAFAAQGIAPDRLIVSAWLADTRTHLDAYNQIDIALDPHPYNGTTTTLEALWMGVPVVTLAGERHASRVGASLLTQFGSPDLIAGSADAYVETAVGLAADRERLSRLRRTARERLASSPLMDTKGFARDLEAAYRAMWRAWCARHA